MHIKMNITIKYIILIQIAFLGVMFAQLLGFDMPIIQPILGFLYITLIPGTLILMGLKIEDLPISKFCLYASGLSLAFLMFGGFLLNQILLYLNINHPLSLLTLTAFYAIVITPACLFLVLGESLNYFPLHKFPASLNDIRQAHFLSYKNILIVLLPILAILGTLICDGFYNNLLILFLYVVIAIIFVFIAFDKVFPEESYPFVLFLLSFSLILLRTFISPYPVGYNLDGEYYYSTLVLGSMSWDISGASTINSLLSITMIPAIYSFFSGLWINGTYKIVYSLFQALIPLSIYWIVKDYLGSKRALVSSFFVLLFSSFLSVIILFRREVIALFFLSLILLTVNDRFLNKKTKQIFLMIFLISLPVSHYGYSTIFTLILILALIIFYFRRFFLRDTDLNRESESYPILLKPIPVTIFLLFFLIWSIYTTSHVIFDQNTSFTNYFSNVFNQYLNLETKANLEMFGIGTSQITGILPYINRYLLYSIEIFYITGFIMVLFFSKKISLSREYICLIISAFVVFIILIGYPYLTFFFTFERFITLTLLIGAPLVVIGFETIITPVFIGISRIADQLLRMTPFQTFCKKQVFTSKFFLLVLICFFLIPNFLFSSGLVNAVMRIGDSDYLYFKSVPANHWEYDGYYYTEGEAMGANWIADYYTTDMHFTYDDLSSILINYDLMLQHKETYQQINDKMFSLDDTIPKENYVFLRDWNIRTNQIRISGKQVAFENAPQIRNDLVMRNSIYCNGHSAILSPGLH